MSSDSLGEHLSQGGTGELQVLRFAQDDAVAAAADAGATSEWFGSRKGRTTGQSSQSMWLR